MKYSKKKIHSFGKVFGGKNRYSRAYIKLFPHVDSYSTYLEPFAGGAGILMNKERSQHEIISDINSDIHNVLHSLQNSPKAVKSRLYSKYADYSQETFEKALSVLSNSIIKNERAAAYIAANRMSSNGMFQSFAKSNRLRGGQMGDKNAYENYIYKEINLTIMRLQGVKILNVCAFDLIEKHRNSSTLIYLDPPYLKETRVSKNIYLHEFSNEEHLRLLLAIKNHPAKIFLSGYDSPLYREHLSDWKTHYFERPADSGRSDVKTRRLEMVWENHP